jgi:hypothetical protein
MGLLLFMLFAFMLIRSVYVVSKAAAEDQRRREAKSEDKNKDYVVEDTPKEGDHYVVEDVKKFCPPHKWRYQEVRNREGETVRWRLICDLCGPLKPSSGPARME